MGSIFFYFLIVIVILLLISTALITVKNKKKSKDDKQLVFKYESVDLLTKAEKAFFKALTETVGSSYIIFSKVRLADLFQPKKGLYSKSKWQTAFNKISRKHVDFVLCDPLTFKAVLGVELDDSSHNLSNRKLRDGFVDKAFLDAKIPLHRQSVKFSYETKDLRDSLKNKGLKFEPIGPYPESQMTNALLSETQEDFQPVEIKIKEEPRPVEKPYYEKSLSENDSKYAPPGYFENEKIT